MRIENRNVRAFDLESVPNSIREKEEKKRFRCSVNRLGKIRSQDGDPSCEVFVPDFVTRSTRRNFLGIKTEDARSLTTAINRMTPPQKKKQMSRVA